MPNLHVIYRREPTRVEQWSVYSFPVSVYTGGSTLPEARSRFREAAEFGVDGFEQYRLVEHIEEPFAAQAFLRTAVDRRSLDRREAVQLFVASHTVAAQAEAFERTAPRDSSGDAVVVACVASDTVRWVLEQMGEQDALSICVALPGRMVWWSYLAQQLAGLPEANPTESLADAGLELDATLSEFMRVDAVNSSRRDDQAAEPEPDEVLDVDDRFESEFEAAVRYRPGVQIPAAS